MRRRRAETTPRAVSCSAPDPRASVGTGATPNAPFLAVKHLHDAPSPLTGVPHHAATTGLAPVEGRGAKAFLTLEPCLSHECRSSWAHDGRRRWQLRARTPSRKRPRARA
eukprot:3101273-Pyramimonas_sp.AAC.1